MAFCDACEMVISFVADIYLIGMCDKIKGTCTMEWVLWR